MKLFLLTSWYCLYLWHDIPCEYMKLSDYKEENSLIIPANLPRLCAVLTNLSLCINSNEKHTILPVTNVASVQNKYTTGQKNMYSRSKNWATTPQLMTLTGTAMLVFEITPRPRQLCYSATSFLFWLLTITCVWCTVCVWSSADASPGS